jgi:hypothetical protein
MAEKTLREAVRAHLVTNCPSITGGFFQPQAADKSTTKPFAVLRLGPEDADPKQGYSKRVLVTVHAERGDYDTLDSLVRSVVDALNGGKIPAGSSGGTSFYVYLYHTGTTAEWHDDDRLTIFKTAEFETKLAR